MAFLQSLEEYPIEDINRAFARWLKHSKNMPTPADIIGLIEPEDYFPQSTAPEHQAFPEPETDGMEYSRMDDAARAELDRWLLDQKQQIRGA